MLGVGYYGPYRTIFTDALSTCTVPLQAGREQPTVTGRRDQTLASCAMPLGFGFLVPEVGTCHIFPSPVNYTFFTEGRASPEKDLGNYRTVK